MDRLTTNQRNETCVTSAADILVVEEHALGCSSRVIVLDPPHFRSTVMTGPSGARSVGSLSERKGGETHMPEQIKHEFAVSSGSKASNYHGIVCFKL